MPLPAEVNAFLLVGRIVQRNSGGRTQRGVVKHCWTKFGTGEPIRGLPCWYPQDEGSGEACAMPMEMEFGVKWDGSEELEQLSLAEVQRVCTYEFTSEDWLPPAIRKLSQDDWGQLWDELEGDRMAQFLAKARKEAEKVAAKAPAKRAAGGAGPSRANPSSKSQKASKKSKEKEPLGKPDVDLGARLQAKWASKRPAAAAAPTEGAPPAVKKARAGKAPQPPATSSVPAAAAAAVVPSGGQGSPAEGRRDEACSNGAMLVASGPRRQGASESHVTVKQRDGSGKAKSMPTGGAGGGSQGRQLAAAAGKAPGSKGKQTVLSPTKSTRSAVSSEGGPPAAEVLRQEKQAPLRPKQSQRLSRDDWDGDYAIVTGANRHTANVYWFDRVLSRDGTVYRVWSESLLAPEASCYRQHDKRLRKWKVQEHDPEADYAVEALLAEREEPAGLVYLVKYKGYEADPAQDGWLSEEGLGDCPAVLRAWKAHGRKAWEEACHSLAAEAGLR